MNRRNNTSPKRKRVVRSQCGPALKFNNATPAKAGTTNGRGRNHSLALRACIAVVFFLLAAPLAAQDWDLRVEGDGAVSNETRKIFDRGLNYLAASQKEDGTWDGKLIVGGHIGKVDAQGAGATNGETALALMCFLSSGEDPNFGKYSVNVRQAVSALLMAQNRTTGYIGKNMYEHGFAMLALSEAYGAVDENRLNIDRSVISDPSIGQSIELAIGCAINGQKHNVHKAWTYGPENQKNHEGTRADTSISGAVLMGLLGARNAGIKVPDQAIDQALDYFRSMTFDGKTSYAKRMQWATPETRSAITALVFSIAKRTHWKEFEMIPDFIAENIQYVDNQHPFYSRYYMAQALFQVDVEAWKRWHKHHLIVIGDMQQEDGSIVPASKGGFTGGYQTKAYTTSIDVQRRIAVPNNHRILAQLSPFCRILNGIPRF